MESQCPLHTPVLCERAIAALNVGRNGFYCDCTYGRGGHSAVLLGSLDKEGRLLMIDRDEQAIQDARRRWGADDRAIIRHAGYKDMASIIDSLGMKGKVAGILVDAGVSSPQLDDGDRGFSFRCDASLDMRMNQTDPMTAADWLAQVSEEELGRVLREYGEERAWRRVAHALVEARQQTPITRTQQLADIVATVKPNQPHLRKHPATQTFQAIRMAVNDELGQLADLLEQVVDCLKPGGRFVAITFHSLETRLVKQFIQARTPGNDDGSWEGGPHGSPKVTRLRRIGGAIKPSADEIKRNPRARSAVMRVVEKLA